MAVKNTYLEIKEGNCESKCMILDRNFNSQGLLVSLSSLEGATGVGEPLLPVSDDAMEYHIFCDTMHC